MYRINSKFNENSKNYGVIKKEILDVLTDYELALTEFSDYYDTKLEDLILKKVELESHLVGKIFKEESFKTDENNKNKEKQSDKLKLSFSEKTRSIFDKFSIKKKNEKQINFQEINKLQDCVDLENEQNKKLDKKLAKVQEKNKTNQAEIAKLENDIKRITDEITQINETKRLGLEEAMETRDKWIAVTIKKPSVFKRAKSFFANKFNTSKVITKTVINPLKQRVEEFRVNELAELKG
jgi:septal ring factor EnvC (AmiA/AmiB activator)